ncbi:MAG TPA: neutral zinc metallopeptidase [Burkholderiaceae bacterium]
MKWQGREESDDVEDYRNDSGGGGLPIGGRHIGIGGIAVALLASWAFGINPLTVLGLLDQGGSLTQGPAPQSVPHSQPKDPAGQFTSIVFQDTKLVWSAYFAARGQQYQTPVLALYSGQHGTGCGTGQAAMGPFYCPADRHVWIDLDFFHTLADRLGAPGEFARAYVVAHEVGHHIQNLQGTSGKMDEARQRLSERDYNALSVRLELQADCYAGVWAKLSQQSAAWIEPGEVEQALNAASQIGDDTLQKRARGSVVPESFTHGSSAQRVRWFQRGLDAGELKACDTFRAASL